ncbi:hypothetical protein Holit_01221 [Hollandina sp. SP2]
MKIGESSISEPGALRLRQVPPVLRARDFHLYTQGGRRLVDLWQYGGAAVLGHTPRSVLREFKNSAERGLFTPFPHPLENRFTKALSRLFPGTSCRVYADAASLRRALAIAGFATAAAAPFPDPAVEAALPEVLSLWRPFLGAENKESPLFLVPVLPWVLAPKVVVLKQNLDPQALGFPPSDFLPPVLLAGTSRAIYDLFLWPEREQEHFPRIRKVQGIWYQRGIYLHHGEALDEQAYTERFLRFLAGGFLLPPERTDPLILPGYMSKGEEATLAALLQLE